MAAATVDMNRKIILTNLDIIDEQLRQMYHAVDQYVDKVTDAGRQWTTRKERSHSTFLEIHKITSKAMAFLSLKCEEMKNGRINGDINICCAKANQVLRQLTTLLSHIKVPMKLKVKHHICLGEMNLPSNRKMHKWIQLLNLQQHMERVKTMTLTMSKKKHTSSNTNLESDLQTRYQDVYNQLRSVLAKQGELEQQLNMKLNNLREDTERLKSDVGTFNQYVEKGKTLMKDHSQKLETLENAVSCLSERGNEMYSDQQVLVDRINSYLSDKGDQVNIDLLAKVDQNNTDLSAKVDQINTDLSAKVDQRTTELSDKVDEINTGVSAKVDQINVVLQTCRNSEKEHAAQMNKIIALEKHFNTMEKDTQSNDKQVEQQDELGAKLLDASQKLIQLSVEFARKNHLRPGGFNAATTLLPGSGVRPVTMFESPAFIGECQFNSDTGIFTACSQGIYLAYVSACLDWSGNSFVELIHEYMESEGRCLIGMHEVQICLVRAKRKGSTMCSLDVIHMEETDKLFIRTHGHSNAMCRIKFLCFRIG